MASDFYFSDIGALPAIWSTRFLNRMMLLRTFLIKVSFLILITLSLLLISLSLSLFLSFKNGPFPASFSLFSTNS